MKWWTIVGALALAQGVQAAPPERWIASWGAAQQTPEAGNLLPSSDMQDATLRQVVHLSAGGSRLRVRFAEPFLSESHLGGVIGVSEALIGLEHEGLFVGPDFTRHGEAVVEHLQCGYLPSLELACLAELAPHLPARYRETCARLERDENGRIVMPPPDIAPSCS